MKAFLDTSVLVAAFHSDNALHHEPSLTLLSGCAKSETACAAHSLAEVYAIITRMPGRKRVSGDEAMLYIGDIREKLTVTALTEKEYFHALETFSATGILGGAIYDALIAHCALKVNAKAIYTWNTKDFTRLGPAIASRVSTP